MVRETVKTFVPVLYWLWPLWSVANVIVTFMNREGLWNSVIWGLGSCLILWFLFARYACTVRLEEDNLTIRYIFPYRHRLTIDLTKVEKLTIFLGEISSWDGPRLFARFVRPRYILHWPFDTLEVTMKPYAHAGPFRRVPINTSYFGTRRLKRVLEKRYGRV
jgi:hypothetical protein